jgi:inner membrane protein
MPSPLAHSLAGYLVAESTQAHLARKRWVSLGYYILIANLADIDYVPGLFSGQPNAYHHYASHSITAALIFGLAISGALGKRHREFLRFFVVVTFAYGSHVALDYVTMDTSRPYGMQMLWPFSDNFYLSPWLVFQDIKKASTSGAFVESLFVWHNLRSVLWEAAIFLPALVGLHLWKRIHRGKVAGTKA